MLPSNIVRRAAGDSFFQRSAGLACFGSISLPLEEMVSLAEVAGSDLTPPKEALFLSPPPLAMERLQHLHAAAGQLAENAPAVIAVPEAAHGIEQGLIGAMLSCLSTGYPDAGRSAVRKHVLIMRRFRRMVEEKPDQALFIPEVCKTIGTSERTLRECCQEHLGISPTRYLLIRRMHLARRALRESNAAETNVTEVSMRYGFWELGRFSGRYRSLFGELPSVTLAQRPE